MSFLCGGLYSGRNRSVGQELQVDVDVAVIRTDKLGLAPIGRTKQSIPLCPWGHDEFSEPLTNWTSQATSGMGEYSASFVVEAILQTDHREINKKKEQKRKRNFYTAKISPTKFERDAR